jgi:hypothetical protein
VTTAAESIAITEQTTPEFRNDLNRLNSEDRARVAAALRGSYDLLRNNRRGFISRSNSPLSIQLKCCFSKSLYSSLVIRD